MYCLQHINTIFGTDSTEYCYNGKVGDSFANHIKIYLMRNHLPWIRCLSTALSTVVYGLLDTSHLGNWRGSRFLHETHRAIDKNAIYQHPLTPWYPVPALSAECPVVATSEVWSPFYISNNYSELTTLYCFWVLPIDTVMLAGRESWGSKFKRSGGRQATVWKLSRR